MGFFGKIDGFKKNLSFFQNRERLQNCCTVRIEWYHYVKIFFGRIYEASFVEKIKKLWKLVMKYDDSDSSRKQVFMLMKALFFRLAPKMTMVVGRFLGIQMQ